MRKFLNLNKTDNAKLAAKFGFLLRGNDECSKEDCCWAAITIFDHWLHQSHSFHRIKEASAAQQSQWTDTIKQFLRALVQIEAPLKYRFKGRHSKQHLQFARYVGNQDISNHLANQFDDIYYPNVVFEQLGVELWFEDYWTLHFKYKNQHDCLPLLQLATEMGLYILPVSCADNLNDYPQLSQFMRDHGLAKSLYRPVHAPTDIE
ncbi:hypothetical protein L9G74_09705 [Shewanella sp. C32]|uniref:Uncharacterized protein n=1 Tax=Shewanella electrica TaxID=515560 RepID=A0ABT2FK65_9GAMM|nr:hypothetical protein [Shewanella electrica]MCH1924838.1 hypothetical protein [Shewanella electrica]MCS4556715.1 hypothetical protein [Shewanella electrica]